MVEVILEEEFHHVRLLRALEVSLLTREELFEVDVFLLVENPSVLLRVEEGTLEAFKALEFFTWEGLINEGMELLLLPPVTVRA